MAAGGGSGNSKAIEAGRAYVRLNGDDKGLRATIAGVPKLFSGVGKKLAGVGAGMAAVGAGILAPLAGLASHFIDAGSAITDMSERLGATTEELSAMAYGLELGGGSVEDLETSMKKMHQFMAKNFGGAGGDSATDMMMEFADQIAAMKDPTQQTAAAMEIFGKSGTKMLPFLKQGREGIKAMMDQAGRDGAVWSKEDAEQADRIGDAISRVKTILASIGKTIGGALLPDAGQAEQFAASISLAGQRIRQFIRDNAQVIKIVGLVGAALVAGGAVLAGVGTAFIVAGAAISGVVAVLGAVLSPVGLIVAGLVAITAGLGIMAYESTNLGEAFSTAFGGILDALKGGDLELAGELAMVGLELEFQRGIGELEKLWIDFRNFFEKLFDDTFRAIGVAFQSFLDMFPEKFRGLISDLSNLVPAVGIAEALGFDPLSKTKGDSRQQLDDWNKADRDRNAAVDAEKAAVDGRNKDLEDQLAKLRERARQGVPGGTPEPVKVVTNAIQSVTSGVSAVKGMFGGGLLGASLGLGENRKMADDIKGTREATERMADAIEDAPPFVWGT